MKIRPNFVSNSSSSSFIIDNVETTTCDITCDKLIEAIRKCFSRKLSDNDVQFYILDRDHITDKEFKKNISEVKKNCYSELKGWTDGLNPLIRSYELMVEQLKRYGKTDYNPDITAYQQDDKPLETPIIQTINILKKNMGIKSIIECIEMPYSKLLIMMNENVVWEADGIRDPKKKGSYETEPYTVKRFCELISKQLWQLDCNIDYNDLYYAFHGCAHMG